MYAPKHFRVSNPEVARAFVLANPFAIIVSQTDHLIASHMPLEITEKNGKTLLVGHVSKQNEQWESFADAPEVMAIFSGSHSYVSSSWYSHYNVPTWNYQAAHLRGKGRLLSETELRESLLQLMERYEKDSENPLALGDLPEAYVNQAVKGIVGIAIEVERWEVQFKLSQNRKELDYWEIIRQLEKRGDPGSVGVAEAMRKNAPEFK